MKKFIQHNGIWVLVLALVLTAAVNLGSVFFPGLMTPATNTAGVLGTPFRAVATLFANGIEKIYDYTYRYRVLEDEVADLKQQVADMAEENRNAQAAMDENERLRELLKLREARSEFQFESSMVTGRSTNSWESTITISKGTNCGLQVDMCVVNENGYLVGVISEVGTNWATVRTLIDPQISLGVTDSNTSDEAILTSNLNLMKEGTCRLSYLDSEATVTTGDTVITSGLGGVYPKGLEVGTVISEGTESSGMALYATVEPSVNLDELEQVFVIKSFDVIE